MVKHKIEVISTTLVEKISEEAAFLASTVQLLNPWISDKVKSKKTIRNSLKSFQNVQSTLFNNFEIIFSPYLKFVVQYIHIPYEKRALFGGKCRKSCLRSS